MAASTNTSFVVPEPLSLPPGGHQFCREEIKEVSMNHAVRYDKFGNVNVLHIEEMPIPTPQANQVLVKVKAAGINPGDAYIREGNLKDKYPSTFPSGQGSDFAGVVESVGATAQNFKKGDEVIGFSNDRNSQAEYVVVDAGQLTPRPNKVSWEQAGGLFVTGTTAYAGVQALAIRPGDNVVISGAAGGVGSLAVQLAKLAGANVYGFAGKANSGWLKSKGIIPIEYGKDNKQALLDALGGKKITAFFDTVGGGYVALAVELGVPPERINTIIDFAAAKQYKVKTVGNSEGASAQTLKIVAGLVAAGRLEMPVARTYPLTEVKAAFNELEKGHTHGKIVLLP
jgi:NADPH:quinone reductase-like Zn-dependent oxidoreductase